MYHTNVISKYSKTFNDLYLYKVDILDFYGIQQLYNTHNY